MDSAVQWMWKLTVGMVAFAAKSPLETEIEDLYRSPKFPHWVGFLWTPRFKYVHRPVSLERLKSEIRNLHAKIRRVL